MSGENKIGIVGGGPCGMMTALLLARHGTGSIVFERKPDISTHPKAMGVSRRTAARRPSAPPDPAAAVHEALKILS